MKVPVKKPSAKRAAAKPGALPAERQLASFLAKYTPAIQAAARKARRKMRARLPGAFEMVYDNYNALVIGYGPTERPSEALFSLVFFPRKLNLCFIQGAKLPDPKRLLRGAGNQVRNILLEDDATLDRPEVEALIAQAIALSPKPFDHRKKIELVIRSISAKQRPRRPPGA